MIFCQECDYLKIDKENRKCELLQHVFSSEFHDIIDYPCKDTCFKSLHDIQKVEKM